MKLLLLGSGGREHALAWKISKSSQLQLYVAPGNAGASEIAENIAIDINNFEAVGNFVYKSNQYSCSRARATIGKRYSQLLQTTVRYKYYHYWTQKRVQLLKEVKIFPRHLWKGTEFLRQNPNHLIKINYPKH